MMLLYMIAYRIVLRVNWLIVDIFIVLHKRWFSMYYGIRYRFMSRDEVLRETMDTLGVLRSEHPEWITQDIEVGPTNRS